MKVVSVVGARPQLVKLAPIAAAFAATEHEHVIVHTGQHYDADLSDVFFSGLGIPDPDVHLGIGSGSHGVQTGAMLAALDPVLARARPDWVLVYGDTNSTLAGALSRGQACTCRWRTWRPACARSTGGCRRSTTGCSPTTPPTCCSPRPRRPCATSPTRAWPTASVLVGDVMVDVCLRVRDAVLAGDTPPRAARRASTRRAVPARHPAPGGEHRRPGAAAALVTRWPTLPVPVALLAHPRLVARAEEYGLKLAAGRAARRPRRCRYAGMVAAVLGSAGVVTDSGGLQKEAYLLERPAPRCARRPSGSETLADGWNLLGPPRPHWGWPRGGSPASPARAPGRRTAAPRSATAGPPAASYGSWPTPAPTPRTIAPPARRK